MKQLRVWRILKWAGLSLAIVLLLAAGTAWYLVGTERGARTLFNQLGALMPGSFKVAELTGKIEGPLSLRGLLYKRSGLEIRVERIDLDWRLRELLDRRLDILRLAASGVTILSTPTPASGPTTLPDLNLHFNILVRSAVVRGLTVGAPGDPHPTVIDSVDLATTDIANVVRLDHLAVRSALLNADVRGTLQPSGDYPLDLALHWSAQPAGMAPLAGNGTLRGTLKNLTVRHALSRPFPAFVSAVLTDPLNDIGFDGRIDFRGVNPHQLAAEYPDIPASGQVSLRGKLDDFVSSGSVAASLAPTGPVAVHYQLLRQKNRWHLDRAEVTFPGTAARVSASGDLKFNPAAAARAFADQPLDAHLSAQWQAFAWPPRGTPSFASERGALHLDAHGSLNKFASQGAVEAALPPMGPLNAHYRIRRDVDRWAVDDLELTAPGRATQIKVQGSAVLTGRSPNLDAQAEWRQASWPLNGPPSVVSPAGHAQLRGPLDHYRADLVADLAGGPGGQIPPGHWTLNGTGDTRSFHLDQLAGAVLNGAVSGSGAVAWDPALKWDLRLAGTGIDPRPIQPDLPGKLDFAAVTSGASAAGGLAGRVELRQLSGTLRQRPINAQADLSFRGSELAISRASVNWSTAQLRAQGRLGNELDLGWSLRAPNLSVLVPSLSGALSADGHLAGPLQQSHVRADIHTRGLRSGTDALAEGDVRADVDLAPAGRLEVNADLKGLVTGGQTINTLTVKSHGTSASHTLELAATGLGDQGDARLDLALAGGLSGGLGAQSTWRGSLTRLNTSAKSIGAWSLDHAVAVTAAANAFDARDFCWHSGAARVCSTAAWRAEGPWSLEATLTALPLNLARPVIPSEVTITGAVSGHLRASGTATGLRSADVDLTPGPGALRYAGSQGEPQEVPFDRGTIRAQAGPGGGTGNASLTFRDVGSLQAQIRLPQLTSAVPLAKQALTGHLEVHWSSLAPLAGLAPDLRQPQGSLQASIDLGGTAGSPSLRGHASLTGGQAKLPRYGLDLRDVHCEANGDGAGALDVNASARSGKGTITIRGKAGLAPSTTTPIRLALTGNRFQVMNTTDIELEVSPRLELTYTGATAHLDGEVTIPVGRIWIEQRSKAGPVEPSKDVVLVSSHPEAHEASSVPLGIIARVRVIVPENSLDLNALGLTGRPYGEVLAVDQPGKPTTGSGQFQIDQGAFAAYGANLTLERARLIFTGGPIDDPALNIRASRRSDDLTVTAGLNVTGTAQDPKTAVWSSPEMDTSDALAYMVLGHPLGQASAADGNVVANAATSLGLKGGNLIAAKVASRFGLQQVSLESSGSLSQTSLMLGKYLSPRIYVLYGIGLFQPINTFRVRYILNKRFALQAESAAGATGGDLLYTIEH